MGDTPICPWSFNRGYHCPVPGPVWRYPTSTPSCPGSVCGYPLVWYRGTPPSARSWTRSSPYPLDRTWPDRTMTGLWGTPTPCGQTHLWKHNLPSYYVREWQMSHSCCLHKEGTKLLYGIWPLPVFALPWMLVWHLFDQKQKMASQPPWFCCMEIVTIARWQEKVRSIHLVSLNDIFPYLSLIHSKSSIACRTWYFGCRLRCWRSSCPNTWD